MMSPSSIQEAAPSPLRRALLLGLAVVAISFAAIFFKKAAPTHPLVAAAVRLLLTAGMLLPLVVRARLSGRLPNRVLGPAILAGVCYAVHFGSWVSSLTLTSVAASVTLVTATPLLLCVASILTGRDRPDGRLWGALGLAVIGILLIGSDQGSAEAGLGNALALLGAAAMAVYMWVARGLGEALDPLAFTGVAAGVGALILVSVAWISGVPLEVTSLEAFGFIALTAIVPQLIGHTLLTWSLRHMSPVTVGIATLGEAAGASALAWLWFGESITGMVFLGCGVTLAGIALAVLRRSPTR
jgi:drug/metabolite transporter (DMT)-like permease